MKLYQRDAPLFCSTSSLPPFFEQDEQAADPATEATTLLDEDSKQESSLPDTTTTTTTPRRKVVRFQPDDKLLETIHDDKNTVRLLSAEECQTLWYKQEELLLFRLQNRNNIRRLRHLQLLAATTTTTEGKDENDASSSLSWAAAYSDVYHACCQARSEHDELDSTASLLLLRNQSRAHCTIDVYTAGMERRAVPAVTADTLARRRELVHQVLHWQQSSAWGGGGGRRRSSSSTNVELRNRVIREFSEKLSRPARLYARHVATVSAVTEW